MIRESKDQPGNGVQGSDFESKRFKGCIDLEKIGAPMLPASRLHDSKGLWRVTIYKNNNT